LNILPAPPIALLRDASLFLDFDGTLVEIAEHPDAVQVGRQHASLLSGLYDRLNGRIALVSGRPAQQVRTLLPENGVTVVGSHGLEFLWADGLVEQPDQPPGLAQASAAMHEFARAYPGVLVEEKPFGIALHYRRAPSAEQASTELAVYLGSKLGLQLQRGKMMVELRATGGDKGSAVRRLMRASGFAGTRPLFLGDDLTDEPAFLAVREMGGAGVLVGAPRPTAASYRLKTVADVHEWLAAACEAAI
jgi:trehalose 6-phosphate phosphatase